MSELLTMQDLANGHLDVKALGEAANGDENTIVTTRTGNTYPSAERAINIMFQNGGLPATPFATKALMTASALADGKYAQVTEGGVDNGLYVKTAGVWVKSSYDPLTLAKADAATKANNAKSEAITESTALSKTYTDNEIKKTHELLNLEPAAILLSEDDTVVASISSDGVISASDFKSHNGSLSDAISKTDSISQLDAGSAANVITDESGTVLFGVGADGGLITPYAPIAGLGIDAIRSQMLPPVELEFAGRYLDKLAVKDLEPLNWDVMVAADSIDGLGINRMASFIEVEVGKYYVVFSQYAGSGTDQIGARLVGRFVDVNFETKTSVVSETRVIYDGLTSNDYAPKHPNLIKIKDGYLLLFNIGFMFHVYKSTDGCKTWTSLYAKAPDAQRTYFLVPDCTVTIPDGFYKGRIACVGFDNQEKGHPYWMLTCMYSDDDGVTWNKGFDVAPLVEFGSLPELNETALTTDTDNNLIMVVRDGEYSSLNSTVGKPWFKSTDGGLTLKTHQTITPFTTGVSQNGITQFAPYSNMGIPKVITTSTFPVSGRRGLTMRVSYSNMQTWLGEYTILDGSVTSGYSCVRRVRDAHTLAVVYEYGGFNIKSNIAIRFLNLKEVL